MAAGATVVLKRAIGALGPGYLTLPAGACVVVMYAGAPEDKDERGWLYGRRAGGGGEIGWFPQDAALPHPVEDAADSQNSEGSSSTRVEGSLSHEGGDSRPKPVATEPNHSRAPNLAVPGSLPERPPMPARPVPEMPPVPAQAAVASTSAPAPQVTERPPAPVTALLGLPQKLTHAVQEPPLAPVQTMLAEQEPPGLLAPDALQPRGAHAQSAAASMGPEVSVGMAVVARRDMGALGPGYLALRAGARVEVLYAGSGEIEEESGWLFGRLAGGEEGWLPQSAVDASADVAARPAVAGPAGATADGARAAGLPPGAGCAGGKLGAGCAVGKLRVGPAELVRDVAAAGRNYLSAAAGEVVMIDHVAPEHSENAGWACARKADGREGWLPVAALQGRRK